MEGYLPAQVSVDRIAITTNLGPEMELKEQKPIGANEVRNNNTTM